MHDIQKHLVTLASRQPETFPKIICFYTGSQTPKSCEPMPRSPSPPVGITLNEKIAKLILRATSKNRSLHDGALMIGRHRKNADYSVTGWSYRLFPSPHPGAKRQNRGAAFNSCLAMSNVRSVDCLYLLARDGIIKFTAGRFRTIRSSGIGGAVSRRI
ncbi:MAG: hypothetical protein JWO45_1228 [Spartobacteria bacterium]|nr:hypothetical protein [Spartobacteria bacterium]